MRTVLLAAATLIMCAAPVAAVDLPKLDAPKLTDIKDKSLLDTVNKKLAQQQIKDGQFQFKTGKAEFATGNEKRIDGLLKIITDNSKALKSAFPDLYVTAEGHTDADGTAGRPERTAGTYSKYSSIDDKIDDLHYYTTWIKFGLGRASYDASQEIRNRHLTREDGIALVKQFDGESPIRYVQEALDYIGLDIEEFRRLCDEFRSPHLWTRDSGQWQLRHPVWAAERPAYHHEIS